MNIKAQVQNSAQQGYVALLTAIILCLILLGLTFTLSSAGFFARAGVLGGEFKRISLGLAESCANAGLLKLAQNYNYTVNSDVSFEPGKGARVDVGGEKCYIESVSPPNSNHQRTVKTMGIFRGAVSKIEVLATVQDLSLPPLSPPPACTLTAAPPFIYGGNSSWLTWSTLNASSFSLDHGLGIQSPVNGGAVSVSPTLSVTYNGTATGMGGSTVCSASITVQPPPACADTLMMLDRTGSLTGPGINMGTDLYNERQAAKGLLDLYKAVVPTPQAAIGRFGDTAKGGQEAEIQAYGQLTSNYGDDDLGNDADLDLYQAAEAATAGNSIVGTNPADAIGAANSELNSLRHDLAKEKVLILISDGIPSDAFEFPGSTAAPNDWDQNSPVYIQSSNDVYITEDDGGKQGYMNFGFNLPSNYPISGIEVMAEVKSSDPAGCRLGVDLSWNGGLTFTSQKTRGIAGMDQVLSFGTSADLWGRLAWQTPDFSDGSFIVRLEDIDPGTSCDNSATTYIDQLQVGVYYDEVKQGLDAADVAKKSGTRIFTIHFGADPSGVLGQELLAQMSSGLVNYAGHEPGSADDQANPALENSDGDHFFISPASSDMPAIFQTIGGIVCPAAAAPLASPKPPPPPSPPPLPPNISINSWVENP